MKEKQIYKLIKGIIFVLIGLMPFLWYRPGLVIHGVDISLPLNLESFLKKGIVLWDYSINAGKSNYLSIPKLGEFYFLWLCSYFSKSADIVEIFYLSLISFSVPLSFYFFAKQIDFGFKESGLAPLFSSIFYLFNFFALTRFEAVDRPIFYVLIGTPLVCGCLLKIIKNQSNFWYFCGGLSSMILVFAGFNPPSFLVGVITVVLFYFFLLAEALFKKDLAEFKKRILIGIKTLLISVFFNLYWLVPTVVSSSPRVALTQISPADWLEPISKNTSFKNVIRLMGAWYWYEGWGDKPYAPYAQIYFQNPIFKILTWLVPIFGLLGFLMLKKRKKNTFFVFVTLLGLIFSMGVHPPFGRIYKFFYERFFVLKIFRSPWFKFSYLTIFGYSFFYGVFANTVFNIVKKQIKKVTISVFILIILISFPFFLNYPLLTGRVFDNYRVKIPYYVFETLSFLEKNMREGERTLLLPFTKVERYHWGYQSEMPIIYYLSDISILGPWIESMPNDPTADLLRIIKKKIYTENFERVSDYLLPLGVKNIIQRNDVEFQNNDPPDFIKEILSDQVSIRLIKTFGKWDIYGMETPYPLFYGCEKPYLVNDINLFFQAKILKGGNSVCFVEKKDDLSEVNYGYQLTPRDMVKNLPKDFFYRFYLPKSENYIILAKFEKRFHKSPSIWLDGEKIILKPAEGKDLNFFSELFLEEGDHLLKINEPFLSFNSLIKNGDFSKDTSWWDLLPTGSVFGEPRLSLKNNPDGGVEIEAINQSTAMVQKVTGLEEGEKYRLRFAFKNKDKQPLQVGIWREKPTPGFIVNPNDNLFYSDEGDVKEIVFSNIDSSTIYVYFYANVNSKNPINRQIVEKVTLDKIEGLEYIILVPQPKKEESNISYTKVGSSEYLLDIKTENPTWLVLNYSFNDGWKALDEKGRELRHIEINGFANGFLISEAGEHKIKVFFRPQIVFRYALFFSLISITVLGIIVIYEKK